MLEVFVAVVCLALGFVLGIYMRRTAIADFERGVQMGLAHLPALIKPHQQPQQQRPDNQRAQQTVPDKK